MRASIYLAIIFFAIFLDLERIRSLIQALLVRTVAGERTAELLQFFLDKQQNCWNFL